MIIRQKNDTGQVFGEMTKKLKLILGQKKVIQGIKGVFTGENLFYVMRYVLNMTESLNYEEIAEAFEQRSSINSKEIQIDLKKFNFMKEVFLCFI